MMPSLLSSDLGIRESMQNIIYLDNTSKLAPRGELRQSLPFQKLVYSLLVAAFYFPFNFNLVLTNVCNAAMASTLSGDSIQFG